MALLDADVAGYAASGSISAAPSWITSCRYSAIRRKPYADPLR
jgi:hypothetical protein